MTSQELLAYVTAQRDKLEMLLDDALWQRDEGYRRAHRYEEVLREIADGFNAPLDCPRVRKAKAVLAEFHGEEQA